MRATRQRGMVLSRWEKGGEAVEDCPGHRGPDLKGSCPKCGYRTMRLEPEFCLFQVFVWAILAGLLLRELKVEFGFITFAVWMVAAFAMADFFVRLGKRFHVWVCQGPAWNNPPEKEAPEKREKTPPVAIWHPPWEKKRTDAVPAVLILLGVAGLFAFALATGPGIWPDYIYEGLCPNRPSEVFFENESFFTMSFILKENAGSFSFGSDLLQGNHPWCLKDPRRPQWNITKIERFQRVEPPYPIILDSGFVSICAVDEATGKCNPL